jgi:hypothetical protein
MYPGTADMLCPPASGRFVPTADIALRWLWSAMCNSDIRLGCACTGSVPRASIALADEIAFHLIKKQFR